MSNMGSAGAPSNVGGGSGSGNGGSGGGGMALGGGDGLPPPIAPMDPAVFAMLPHNTSTGPIIAVSILCMLVAATAVSLRVYTRQFLLNRVGPDDFMAVAALAGVVALGSITIIHTNFGLGSHIYDIAMDPFLIMDFFKFFYLGVVVYNVSLVFVKLSLFLQYYRLVDQVPRYRPLFLCAGFVVMGWTVAMIFTMTFICIPVYAYWDKSVPHMCLSDPVMQLTNSIGNIITDVILLLLPMPVLWRLNLPTRQKWSVIGIFSLGFITCIVSLLRVIFVFDHGPSSDITFEGTTITGWTIAEVTTGLLASSLITLRPLMSKLSPAAWRSRLGKSTNGGNTTGTGTGTNTTERKSTDNKNGIVNANDEPPIPLQPVLTQKQYQHPQQQQQQNSRPYSFPESEEGGLDNDQASRDSSDVELVVQKPTPNTPATPFAEKRRRSRVNSAASLAAVRDATGWGPPPPAPPFYFAEEQQQQETPSQQRRAQQQQEYQRHRQSRSATFYNNSLNYNPGGLEGGVGAGGAGTGIGRASSSSTTSHGQLGQGPPGMRNNQHRRHASTKSADRVISLHPSYSTSSYSTTPPPPPPPKSPWALNAAVPPPPMPRPSNMGTDRQSTLPPLPALPQGRGMGPAGPSNPLPATPRAPRPPPKHSHSQSSSSTRSDISYEVKVWSQKGAGGPRGGVDDRRF
ncbi:hypothetical protein PG994_009547 [Apiospora phragmitis]|uniref:Rhodopsin domain-containing protein n=1 Tax=Apiospora phragmitis TaxID=2905665 RepID=A0ABR1U6E7_9PEZI